MSTTVPARDTELELLDAVQRRVLWLATSIVHHANRVRKTRSGVKVGGQDAARDVGAVVEPRLGEHVEHAAGRARLGVGAAVDDARHAREDDRPGAHGARLERHDERGVEHAPRAEGAGRLAERDRLGVRGRVLAQLPLVVPGADDRAVADDDRADRHVVVVERALGLRDGEAHERLVVGLTRAGLHERIIAVGGSAPGAQ